MVVATAGTTVLALTMPTAVVVLAILVVIGVVGLLLWRLQARGSRIGELVDELARTRRQAAAARELTDEITDRLGHALDAIPQGVLITDAAGRVVFRNQIAESFESARHSDALVEAAISELVTAALSGHAGRRTIDLFGPPRRTLVIATTPLLDDPAVPRDVLDRDGSEPDGAGDPGPSLPVRRALGGALAIVDDISERRRLEATRRDFVANISHELRTPIGAVGLLADTLVAEDDPAVATRLAERIVTEVFRLARTIEDLLVLSTIETEEAPAREPVPVHLVVAEAVERMRPAAEQAGIDIEVAEPDRRMGIFGDRRQVTSALYNLLDNAVKYSDAGSVVEVSAATDGIDVVIRVRDRGIGIPKADLERIFERFYRVDQARSRATGGTGLGLAIVRHVATNHQGDVKVSSRLGEGSTFELVLPSASGPLALAGRADTSDHDHEQDATPLRRQEGMA
jgi:two-component system, OmpR family, sensor histidine kinase SenX3